METEKIKIELQELEVELILMQRQFNNTMKVIGDRITEMKKELGVNANGQAEKV